MTTPATILEAEAPLRGDVTMRVRDVATGAVLRTLQLRNKILHDGYAALLALLDSADATRTIARLRVGTNASSPLLQDADVKGPIAVPVTSTYPFGKVDFTTVRTQVANAATGTYELVVSATCPGGTNADAYNGVTLTEAALILGNGKPFSREVHPALQKTSAIAVDYEWHIRFIPA